MIEIAKSTDTPDGFVIRAFGFYWNGLEFDDLMCARVYPSYRSARTGKGRTHTAASVIIAVRVTGTPAVEEVTPTNHC